MTAPNSEREKERDDAKTLASSIRGVYANLVEEERKKCVHLNLSRLFHDEQTIFIPFARSLAKDDGPVCHRNGDITNLYGLYAYRPR